MADVDEIVRRVLQAPDAELIDHRLVPLDHDSYLPGRSVVRFRGQALVSGARRSWSVVRKWTAGAQTPRAPVDRARREAFAYRSGLLDDIGDLHVPRAWDINLADDGSTTLWLEDVRDSEPWTMATYRRAAHALGTFNGAFLTKPAPERRWLVGDWAHRQSEPVDLQAVLRGIEVDAATDAARRALGDDAGERARALQEHQPAFIELLGRLPQTLCHHDAARSNLVARRACGRWEIVAFDWESAGPGAVGAEIATLVSASLRKGDVPPDETGSLDRNVFEGYVAGLRTVGWSGDHRIARLGYTAALALRAWFVRGTLRDLADRGSRPVINRAPHLATDEVRRRFASISRFLLGRADEARQLSVELDLG